MATNRLPLKIVTDETLRENALHGSAAYPFQFYQENLWDYDFHSIDWHWHPELEFVYVAKGSVHCYVGGERYTLLQGCGVFINSCIVHRFTADGDAEIPNFVFSPSLIAAPDSLIYQRYIQPLLTCAMPSLVLCPAVAWQEQVLQRMIAIIEMHAASCVDEWHVYRCLIEIWDLLLDHMERMPNEAKKAGGASAQARLQLMLQYIRENHHRSVTLQEIADTVYISKSSALQIFQNGIHMSPFAYLIQHRLKCAARLLQTTEESVGSIAEQSGFKSTGYFCRKFKTLYGLSPLEYRRKCQEREG